MSSTRNYELLGSYCSMSILTHALSSFGRFAFDRCLPDSCLLCGADSKELLCLECFDDLPASPFQCCPQCALPTHHGERCGQCLGHNWHFDKATALFHYEFPVNSLIHALKYGGRLALAKYFGLLLGDALKVVEVDRIIPIPLHGTRLKERGFNQSAEIARIISHRRKLRLDYATCQRSRPTPAQTELTLSERQTNIRGAFECSQSLSGEKILLVDDVMTSGATLNECARTLKLHGAAWVETAVIARAVRN